MPARCPCIGGKLAYPIMGSGWKGGHGTPHILGLVQWFHTNTPLTRGMDKDELHELWNQHNDRPAWVRENRDAIHEHTDTSEEVPPGSLYEVRQWLNSYKSVVSKQLKPGEE